METKSLLFGIGGLLVGGLIVSLAATTLNKPDTSSSTHDMMGSMLEGKTGDEYDKAFLQEMIAHHQGAIAMAKQSAAQAKHDEIKQLSQDITIAQEKEITYMQQLQTQWGYTSQPTMEMEHKH